jgi:response regulator RpfG family c-di-GMP phosphodiesterase
MDTGTNAAASKRAERQARLISTFAESTLATSSALRAVLSQLYLRDPDGWAHACRVGLISLQIGEELGELERAAWLHDLGRFVVPDADDGTDGRRPGGYRGEQVRAVFEMTKGEPFLRRSADLVVASRECFDGTGVPHGLEREAIPVGARILHFADVFDAIASLSLSELSLEALNGELLRHAGSRFDPDVVAAWLRCSDDPPSGLVPWLASIERRT